MKKSEKEILTPVTIADKKAYMMRMYGLVGNQMYEKNDKLLITRSGCDKIMEDNYIVTKLVNIQVVPYKDEVFVSCVCEGGIPGSGRVITTIASASPDTVEHGHKHYAEIAESRCRHRILFKALDIWQLDIMPSDGFISEAPKQETIMSEAKQMYEKTQTNRRKRTISKNSK